jgi:hypothetical protein
MAKHCANCDKKLRGFESMNCWQSDSFHPEMQGKPLCNDCLRDFLRQQSSTLQKVAVEPKEIPALAPVLIEESEKSVGDMVTIYPREIETLQRSAYSYMAPIGSQSVDRLSHIVFGIINIVLGLIFAESGLILGIVLSIGLAQIAGGIWNSLRPSKNGVLIDGFLFFFVALANIGIALYNVDLYMQNLRSNTAPWDRVFLPSWISVFVSSGGSFWVGVGIVGFFKGVQKLLKYQNLRDISTKYVDGPASERVRGIIDIVKKSDSATSNDIIEFSDKQSGTKWKGKLFGSVGALVGVTGLRSTVVEVAFVRREMMHIYPQQDSSGQSLKAQITWEKKPVFQAIISPESFLRYESLWKAT